MLGINKIKLQFSLCYVLIQLSLLVNAERLESIANNLESKMNSKIDLTYNIYSEKYDVNISLTNIEQTFSYNDKMIDESSDPSTITFNNVTVIFQFNLIFEVTYPEAPLVIRRNHLSSLVTYPSFTFVSQKDRTFKLDESLKEDKFETYLGDLFDFSYFSFELSEEISKISNFIRSLLKKNTNQILSQYPKCIAQENFEHLSGYVEYYANLFSSFTKVTKIKIREIKNEGIEKMGTSYGTFLNVSMIVSYNNNGIDKKESILYESMWILPGNTVGFGKCLGCTKIAQKIVEETYVRLLASFEWER